MTAEEFIKNYDDGLYLLDEDFCHVADSREVASDLWYGDYDDPYIEKVDYIRGEDRRWSHYDKKIFKIKDRYFEIGCDVGLTEYQENEIDAEIIEVYPVEKEVVTKITEWFKKEK